jgi:hypothetical protein
MSGTGAPVPTLGATLYAVRRPMMAHISVMPEGIAGLVSRGWLEARQIRNPVSLADAIVDLANAALDAGLRPGDGQPRPPEKL